MKTCSKCRVSKDETHFCKRTVNKDGLQGTCRECSRAKDQKRYWENPEKRRASALEYYWENREEVLKNKQEDHKNNPEKRRATSRKHYLKNPGRYRERNLESAFGLSLEGYGKMVSDQNGVCAICNSPPAPGKILCVDHNHATGKLRGLLCTNCNTALGLLKESPATAESLIRYIKKHASGDPLK